MLRVFKASGEEAMAMKYPDFVEMASTLVPGEPVRVRAVMRHLQRVSGQTRFKQRLLVEGRMLADDALLDGPMEAQLVLLPFQESSQDQIKQLYQAAKNNNIREMERLLQRPQDPDLQPTVSVPALHAACGRGSIEAIRLLLEASADKDKAASGHGGTPMHVAAEHGRVEVIKLLMEAKADKDRSANNGDTPMIVASRRGQVEIMKLLLDARADKDKATNSGATPMLTASRKGHLEIVRLLLEANADKDKATHISVTPLYLASQEGHTDVVRLLLQAHADTDKAVNDGSSPIMIASQQGHLEIARLLLEAKAYKDRIVTDSGIALRAALQQGHNEEEATANRATVCKRPRMQY